MSNYSILNLKQPKFSYIIRLLLRFDYKDVIYSANTGFRQKGNGINAPLRMWGVFKIT